MSTKTILVCLTTKAHAGPTLKAAIQLAEASGAHLIGLHTLQALVIYPGVAMHIPDGIYADFSAAEQKVADELQATFEEAVQGYDFPTEWRTLKTYASSAAERIVESARAADLVVMPMEDAKTDRTDQHSLQSQVIRGAGTPVLVIPHDYDGENLGRNVLLGHSDTREAARAAHDVTTVFPGADITVLSVKPYVHEELRDSTGIAMAEFLSRHGHKTEVTHRDFAGHSAAEILQLEAKRTDASVMAVGAFGHSRIYDFVIGATSWTLLRDAKLPVLYSK